MVEIEPTDMVELADIGSADFNDRVRQVGSLLASVEPLDQTVWSLFLEPVTPIANLRGFARSLAINTTAVNQAYSAVKQVAQLLPLKNLLTLPDTVVLKDRNFTLEVTSFVNGIGRTNRSYAPDNRQLAPLKRVLDHAAAALVRLEALRINQNFIEDRPEEYSRETVTRYYEETLRTVTDLTDRTLLGQARERADADTQMMREFFEAQKLIDRLIDVSRGYVRNLQDEGHAKSLDQTKAALASQPLKFPDADPPETPLGEVPPDLLVSCGLGEILDTVCEHVITQSWAVMSPIHEPQKVAEQLSAMLRELMVSSFILQPEKKRHQDNPRLTISVVGLDKISGNLNLKELYVRVQENGQILYIEDFEDGSYVDLFEMREYKPTRIHARAQEKAAEKDTEELQTGRKYLFTVGRTNRLFGQAPGEVVDSCFRGEDGNIKIFST